MTFEEFQQAAARTLPDRPKYMSRPERLVLALGLAGEAGEAIDLIKKVEGHGHDLDAAKLTAELGDVLWYLAALSSAYGLSLNDIACANVDKLWKRYPQGFTPQASRERAV